MLGQNLPAFWQTGGAARSTHANLAAGPEPQLARIAAAVQKNRRIGRDPES
jgi:hypothetical protein